MHRSSAGKTRVYIYLNSEVLVPESTLVLASRVPVGALVLEREVIDGIIRIAVHQSLRVPLSESLFPERN